MALGPDCRGTPSVETLPPPAVASINSATSPSSFVGQPIEILGSDFLASPGTVTFTQAPANAAQIIPPAGSWTAGRIRVNVPSAGAGGPFTVPGSVTVAVTTPGGTSNATTLSLVQSPSFTPSSLLWGTTTALPAASRGHSALAIPGTGGTAFVIVAGGNQLVASVSTNVSSVLTNSLNADGTLGSAWTATTALPAARAYAAAATSTPSNSPVPAGTCFIYVLGGQASASDAPGGTATVYLAPVDPGTGSVGSWSTTSALPIPLLGATATVVNGFLYLLGGTHPDGTSDGAVYTAAVQPDGTLGAWTGAPEATGYPSAVSFSQIFASGGQLYALGGGTGSMTDPTSELQPAGPVSAVNSAPATDGAVGAWTATSGLGSPRQKHALWSTGGIVLVGEGLPGGATSSELEVSGVQADGTLSPFSALSGLQVPGANVYLSAAVTSPLLSAAGTPRFLLLGGQAVATPPATGALSATVWVNTAP